MEQAKVVLVTDVGQGFGRAVALGYGQAGYDVVCADRDVDLAARTAAEIEELGGQAIPLQADPTSSLDVQAAFSKVLEIFGTLSGVVHVAAHESATPFDRLGEAELSELLDENLKSSVLVLRNAQRATPGGWVVLVAPPQRHDRPQAAIVIGALTQLAAAYPAPRLRVPSQEDDDGGDGAPEVGGLRVNVVIPSRSPADPRHDAALVHMVRMLGGQAAIGVHGGSFPVTLPPPPRVVEALLPEVQAALDDTVRQSEDGDDDDDIFLIDDSVFQEELDPVLDEGLDDLSLSSAELALLRLSSAISRGRGER